MDAEIARLRATAKLPLVHELLDALEQARKERDEARGEEAHLRDVERWLYEIIATRGVERDAAQQSAKDARALAYEECARLIDNHIILFCSSGPNQLRPRPAGDRTALDYAAAIRARIKAMLEQKP